MQQESFTQRHFYFQELLPMVETLLSLCLAHSIPGSSSVLVSSHLLQEAFLDHPHVSPTREIASWAVFAGPLPAPQG